MERHLYIKTDTDGYQESAGNASHLTPHECDKCPHPIEPYLGIFASDIMNQGYGMLLDIPRINLFGTQTVSEYIESKNRSVQDKLSRCGIACLRKNPPLGCVLIEGGRAVIALADGHHRVRNLGNTKSKPIYSPILTISVSELSEVLTQANPDIATSLSPKALDNSIRTDITATLASFRSMPAHKQPVPIYGIQSMRELQRRFPPAY
ncbi:MAG TPA: hypothetical protein VFD45_03750 [Patescibacteria group bacterium]|nr:hypothetical protein [Patescibacteria group bacterium]